MWDFTDASPSTGLVLQQQALYELEHKKRPQRRQSESILAMVYHVVFYMNAN